MDSNSSGTEANLMQDHTTLHLRMETREIDPTRGILAPLRSIEVEGMTSDDLELSSSAYPDNIIQLADTFELMVIPFTTMENWCSQLRPTVNAKKTK